MGLSRLEPGSVVVHCANPKARTARIDPAFDPITRVSMTLIATMACCVVEMWLSVVHAVYQHVGEAAMQYSMCTKTPFMFRQAVGQ